MRKPITPYDLDWPALSAQAPALAGSLAFRRFCTPALSERRSVDHTALVNRARYHLRQARRQRIEAADADVEIYWFEPDNPHADTKTILLVHGWTSEASFMTAIAEPLRRSGHRVLIMDCPAHGMSSGSRTSLIGCARAFLEVVDAAEAAGHTVDACVTHSMGSLIALLASVGGAPFSRAHVLDRYVFIASPNRFQDVTLDFGKRLGLTPLAQRYYERHVERVAHRTMKRFTASEYLKAIRRPALLIHSDDDQEITIQNAIEMDRASEFAELKVFSGMGHRRILFASPVIRAVVSYFKVTQATAAHSTPASSTIHQGASPT